jgi:hypothetical protein
MFLHHRKHSSQVALGLRDRDAAQAIVGAKFDNDELRLVTFEQGAEAGDPALRRLAADARVFDPMRIPVFGETLLQERGPAALEPDTITRAETVADDENNRALSKCRWAHQCDET